jgi:ATP-binding cassette, subfamily A (ABC1), member 3
MTYGLLKEKEKKLKEGMKIMGLRDSSFFLSWILWYFIIYLITSVLVSVVLKYSVFTKSNFFLIFFVH